MDETTVAVEGVEPEVSEAPASLLFVMWFPVFCVVVWFMARLFGGRWLDEPEHRPPPDPYEGVPARSDHEDRS